MYKQNCSSFAFVLVVFTLSVIRSKQAPKGLTKIPKSALINAWHFKHTSSTDSTICIPKQLCSLAMGTCESLYFTWLWVLARFFHFAVLTTWQQYMVHASKFLRKILSVCQPIQRVLMCCATKRSHCVLNTWI